MANNDRGEIVSPSFDMDEVLLMSDIRTVESEEAVEESMSEEVAAGPTPMGTLALRIGPAGGVDHVKWLVFSATGGHHWRVSAKKLFANAPKGAHVGGTVMLARYLFYPGGWTTNWQSARDLGVTFFKKKNGSELFTDDEVEEWGEPDFSMRVSIQLEKNVGRATLVTHGLPLKVGDLMGYPGWMNEGRAYPSLLLHGAEMRLGPLSTRNVGLGLTPYVWTEEEAMGAFCVKEVRMTIRKFMEEAEYARTALTPQDLAGLVMGPEAPDTSSQRQPWTWPEMEELEEGEEADEEGTERSDDLANETMYDEDVADRIARLTGKALKRGSEAAAGGVPATNGGSQGLGRSSKRARGTTSALLLPDQWPEGYTIEVIDQMSVQDALSIKSYQIKMLKAGAKNRYLPGEIVKIAGVQREIVEVLPGEDDGKGRIHVARFLRPPTSATTWWGKSPMVWKQELEQGWDDAFGSWNCLAPSVYKACHNRGCALRMKHFIKKNFGVGTRSVKPRMSAVEGSMEVDGLTREFWFPQSIHECMSAVSMLGCVNRELWPWDITTEVMSRVLLTYDYFSNIGDQRLRVRIFEAWFNQVLHTNAANCGSAPMGYKVMERVVKDVLRSERCSTEPMSHGTLSAQHTLVAIRGRDEGNARGRGLGRGRGETVGRRGAVARGGGLSLGPPLAEVVGKVVQERRKAVMGSDRLCVDYSHGVCLEGEDKIGGCKKFGGYIYLHKCGVVKSLNPLELCGGDHEASLCTIV
jgi:hypothetical protein